MAPEPMRQDASASALAMATWTFGPLLVFVLLAIALGNLQLNPSTQRGLFPVILLLAGAGQCRALVLTNQPGKDRPILQRASAFLLTLGSLLLLLLWVGLLVLSVFHLLHPTAPPLFGGR